MSSRKIKSALNKKNYKGGSVIYQRSCPTPSGYGAGYDVEFPIVEEVLDFIYDNVEDNSIDFGGLVEFDDLQSVLDWIEMLPPLPETLSKTLQEASLYD